MANGQIGQLVHDCTVVRDPLCREPKHAPLESRSDFALEHREFTICKTILFKNNSLYIYTLLFSLAFHSILCSNMSPRELCNSLRAISAHDNLSTQRFNRKMRKKLMSKNTLGLVAVLICFAILLNSTTSQISLLTKSQYVVISASVDKPLLTQNSISFSPFRDIKLSPITKGEESTRYSSHHCVVGPSEKNYYDVKFASRTCKFKNLYYSPKDENFHYWTSPTERLTLTTEDEYQSFADKITVSLSGIMKKDYTKISTIPANSIWHPVVHMDEE